MGESALKVNELLQWKNYYFFPLMYTESKGDAHPGEILPFGFLAVENPNYNPSLLELFEIFVKYTRSLIGFLKRIEDEKKNFNYHEKDLTSIQKTIWQQKQLLKYQFHYDKIIGGRSPSMRKVFEALEKIIPSDNSVLIEGESGTGKELFAQTIHFNGPLAEKPIISINCGALHPQILESQLFGHVKGAFSGADEDHDGIFSQVNGGTLYLDELDDMPLEIQTKFLRVLEEGEFRPLGSPKAKRVKFRLLASSQESLKDLAHKGLFREDLYYHINVISLFIPPLRNRKKDIPLLVQHFLKEISSRTGKTKMKITDQTMKVLCTAPWPGNIRQLENVIELSVALTSGNRIDVKSLPQDLQGFEEMIQPLPYEKAKKIFFNDYLEGLLNHTQGKMLRAAKLAGIQRESLYRIMKKTSQEKNYPYNKFYKQ